MELLEEYNLMGLLIGMLSFLIIGLFHPLVIKCEYYYGTRSRWWFLIAGILGVVVSLLVRDIFWSTLLGVLSFTCFWSIKEIKEQEERVHRGWFPRNPNRTYYWDNEECSKPVLNSKS